MIEIRHKDWGKIIQRVDAGTLDGIDLSEANLEMAQLAGANLERAHMRAVQLERSSLFGAKLREADLRQALLLGADLAQADLTRADLRGAMLRGGNLNRAEMAEADLRGACYDRHTHWPAGFDPFWPVGKSWRTGGDPWPSSPRSLPICSASLSTSRRH